MEADSQEINRTDSQNADLPRFSSTVKQITTEQFRSISISGPKFCHPRAESMRCDHQRKKTEIAWRDNFTGNRFLTFRLALTG
jgi:hypothetical protein